MEIFGAVTFTIIALIIMMWGAWQFGCYLADIIWNE